ncbi:MULTISPECIES: bifunctional [glutamine synthetase] adenylyltransferase/[glutamine synthetase]-adenylyl-L-tyrosine phosphorylase [unclassified Iodidimonas]|uniref:bifunctional [glutamine synthetase] adenylyltransferase/[glutamine synthetase]-adenylyl-L-tyrosine phosphorylase n=1 Tax=unclassified Iodidimonas TaxID=2626145 RepID=UPI0024831E4C|nr:MULTISPECIES: bifunctional [glutamine synthetase] adenylyltransferase/[glutamine synthetase]-adenylyl-L-tyrosine phosphorylase [unclassified Iodidimonas]
MPAIAPPYDQIKAADAYDALLKSCDDPKDLALLKQAETKALVHAMAGNSPFLARLLQMCPNALLALLSLGPDAAWTAQCENVRQQTYSAANLDQLMQCLRIAKMRMALLVAAADLSGQWDLGKVTRALSDFADLSIESGVQFLLRDRIQKGELKAGNDGDKPEDCGYFVLAMGKLGAHELNYSSDIDLIVLYDEEIAQATGPRSLSDCMIKITQDLVRILDARTAYGYVFRTDLRLRPDPGATSIALSVGAAESYYQSLAQPWERAAMIKARVCAGDRKAGAAYLQRLSPFIWRRSMDFAAIEDIHRIKNQIHRHHHHEKGVFSLPGFDVKLGRGGIREIEFFTQINQLIAGGRNPALRSKATLETLDHLVQHNRIKAIERDELAQAYQFLRMIEHRLQMIHDAQTHKIPEQPDDLARIACFCGFASPDALHSALKNHLDPVSRHYEALLPAGDETEDSGYPNEAALLSLLEELGFANPSDMVQVIDRWQRGRYRALKTARARKLLSHCLKPLLEAFSGTQQPDRALSRFDSFIAQLPAGVQIFSLFQSNPSLFRLVARIMGIAPALAENMARHPHLVDAILDPGFFAPLPDQQTLRADLETALKRARDYQDILDIVRRWTDERKFQLGVQALEAICDVRETSLSMTNLADAVMETLLPRVEDQYAERFGRFPGGALGIVAMGKYGGRELSFGSDLDLVFLYDVAGDAQQSDGPRQVGPSRYFSGLGQALLTAFTALTSEGRLWEVDTRLRPSGNAGPLVVTLKTFAEYYRDAAWTWEHMALTRARLVATPEKMADDIRRSIHSTLTAGHNPKALLPAVFSMRERLAAQFATDNPWSLKHVRGGLIDMEFIIQYLLLRHGQKQQTIFTPRLDDCIDHLITIKALKSDAGDKLKAAHAHFHAIQSILRLTLTGEPDERSFPPELRAVLARATQSTDFESTQKQLMTGLADVKQIYHHYLGQHGQTEQSETVS